MSTGPNTSTAAKVAGFAAVLTLVFGGAWAAGAQVGPVASTSDPASGTHDTGYSAEPTDPEQMKDDEMNATSSSDTLPGLATAQDGYRLVLADTTLEPGTREVAFTIEGPDGDPVTAFDVEHEKRLHLIVVRRDHIGFQHLHPRLGETTGTWSAQAELTPGTWRAFADFTVTDGPALVLGSDVTVTGQLTALKLAAETRTDDVDGYTVDGTLAPGEHSALTLRVTKGGVPVTDLQPYLGAYGHLVALREGDLAYLHVHPGGEPGDGQTPAGPEIEFGAEVPSTGRYHLYLDFQHADEVRTAHFILDAGTGAGTGSGDHGDDDHTH